MHHPLARRRCLTRPILGIPPPQTRARNAPPLAAPSSSLATDLRSTDRSQKFGSQFQVRNATAIRRPSRPVRKRSPRCKRLSRRTRDANVSRSPFHRAANRGSAFLAARSDCPNCKLNRAKSSPPAQVIRLGPGRAAADATTSCVTAESYQRGRSSLGRAPLDSQF